MTKPNLIYLPIASIGISVYLCACASSVTRQEPEASVQREIASIETHCGVVVSGWGDDQYLIEPAKAPSPAVKWDLSEVEGLPVKFHSSNPWYYPACVNGRTALNPPKFVKVASSKGWAISEKETLKALGVEPTSVKGPVSESLVGEVANELAKLVKTIDKNLLGFNYRQIKQGQKPQGIDLEAQTNGFWQDTIENNSQDIEDVRGLYLAADPFSTRVEFGGAKNEFLLTIFQLAQKTSYIDIREFPQLSPELYQKVMAVGCMIRPGGNDLRSLLMQATHGHCRDLAKRVLKRLQVSLILYSYPGGIGQAYIPDCQNPLAAFLVIDKNAVSANFQFLAGKIPEPDPYAETRANIQFLSQYVESTDDVKISNLLWPELSVLNEKKSNQWARDLLLGCQSGPAK